MSIKQKNLPSQEVLEVKNQLVVIDESRLMYLIGNMFKEIIQKDNVQRETSKEITNEIDSLLTMPQIIDFLKVSKVTIHNWKKKGIIKSHKIGRKLFFKKEEILEAIKRQNYSKSL